MKLRHTLLIAVVLLGACNDNYHDANGDLKVKIDTFVSWKIIVLGTKCDSAYIHDTMYKKRKIKPFIVKGVHDTLIFPKGWIVNERSYILDDTILFTITPTNK